MAEQVLDPERLREPYSPQGGRGYRPYLQITTRQTDDVGESMLLNMGPQHPSTHGVLRIEVILSGEEVEDLRCHLGYLHRCAEKESEASTYLQVVPYTDRLDYVAPMTMAYTYSLAVERLGNFQVADEVEYYRMAIVELQRIASHFLAIGTFGIDMGSFSPFLWAFETRERILGFLEAISGGHLLYNYIWPGGVQRAPMLDYKARIEALLKETEHTMNKLVGPVLSENAIFIQRTAFSGVMTAEVALAYAISGPNLRGSGVNRDLRKDEPYGLYQKVDFNTSVAKGQYGPLGSCLDRYLARGGEVLESVKIIRQCLSRIPDGPLDVHEGLPAKWDLPKGECYFRGEAARGELGVYLVSEGGPKPYRCKFRSPGYHSIQVIPEIARGSYIADLVAIIGSLDFVMGEVDR